MPNDEAVQRRVDLPEGRLWVLGAGAALAEAGVELARSWGAEAVLAAEHIEILGRRGIAKAAPLAASGSRRHGRRRRLGRWLGSPAPREREFGHLRWLRERLFRAPAPLIATCLLRGGRLLHQGLITEFVAQASPLDQHVARHPADVPILARELGRELGRMHALRFLHADLYPRNVLVAPPEFAKPASAARPSPKSLNDQDGATLGRRLVFIDCWAGGPEHRDSAGPRPLPRDLGTWMVDGARLFDRAAQRIWLAEYLAARAANGRPVLDLEGLLRHAAHQRRRQLRRLERQRGRLLGQPFPWAGWDPSGLLPACYPKVEASGTTPRSTRPRCAAPDSRRR